MNCTANQQCATSKANKKNCRQNYSLVHKKICTVHPCTEKGSRKGFYENKPTKHKQKTTTLLFHSWKTNLGKYFRQISFMPNARYNSSVLFSINTQWNIWAIYPFKKKKKKRMTRSLPHPILRKVSLHMKVFLESE